MSCTRTTTRFRSVRAAAAALALGATAAVVAGPALAHPAGNNGTVKIAAYGDVDDIPQNHPHVGCDFQVEWYDFDEGDDIVSTVTAAMHSPTAQVGLTVDAPTTVFVGGDPADGSGSGDALDGSQTYHLTFDGAPHPQQGYHLKLTIHTPGSQGEDTLSKTFWVTGCDDPSTPPVSPTPKPTWTGSPTDTPTATPTPTPTDTPTPTVEVAPTDTPTPTPEVKVVEDEDKDDQVDAPEVKGVEASATATPVALPTAVNAGAEGATPAAAPHEGASMWVALLSMLLGAGLGGRAWYRQARG